MGKLADEAKIICEMLAGFDFARFCSDEKTRRAVCMTLITIGELVNALSGETKAAHPRIPWRAIAGLRDVTAHRYQTLRTEDIWETATSDIPVFLSEVRALMEK